MICVSSLALRRTVPAAITLSAWLFFSHSIAPLRSQAKESTRKIGELQEQLDSVSKTLRRIKDAEQQTGEARASLNRRLSEFPHESAMSAIPKDIRKHFSGFGLPPSVIRLNTAQPEPNLPGWQRAYWSVGLPIAKTDSNLTALLLAVAELDRREPFVNVVDFAVQPYPENPGRRVASLNIMALIRQ